MPFAGDPFQQLKIMTEPHECHRSAQPCKETVIISLAEPYPVTGTVKGNSWNNDQVSGIRRKAFTGCAGFKDAKCSLLQTVSVCNFMKQHLIIADSWIKHPFADTAGLIKNQSSINFVADRRIEANGCSLKKTSSAISRSCANLLAVCQITGVISLRQSNNVRRKPALGMMAFK